MPPNEDSQRDNSRTPGWWELIRDSLTRIEAQLTVLTTVVAQKADRSDVDSVKTRVSDIEIHGSPRSRDALNQTRQLSKRIDDMELGRNMTPWATKLLADIEYSKKTVDDLKSDLETRASIDKVEANRINLARTFKLAVLSAATAVIGVIFSVIHFAK